MISQALDNLFMGIIDKYKPHQAYYKYTRCLFMVQIRCSEQEKSEGLDLSLINTCNAEMYCTAVRQLVTVNVSPVVS